MEKNEPEERPMQDGSKAFKKKQEGSVEGKPKEFLAETQEQTESNCRKREANIEES